MQYRGKVDITKTDQRNQTDSLCSYHCLVRGQMIASGPVVYRAAARLSSSRGGYCSAECAYSLLIILIVIQLDLGM